MDSYIHAQRSVSIFKQGSVPDYLPIHELIDLNKAAEPHIGARFFMHHYDIGGAVLETRFGKTVPGTTVPVKEVILQHLLEDYGQVPVFQDWLDAFHRGHPAMDPYHVSSEEIIDYAKEKLAGYDLSLMNMTALILQVRTVISLRAFTEDATILGDMNRLCIFGHQTGIELLKRIMMPSSPFESDLITAIAWRVMGNPFQNFNMSSISAWMQDVNMSEWMRRPEGGHMDEASVIETLAQIRSAEDPSEFLGIKDRKAPLGPQKLKWRDVNTPPDSHRTSGCGGGMGEGVNMVLD